MPVQDVAPPPSTGNAEFDRWMTRFHKFATESPKVDGLTIQGAGATLNVKGADGTTVTSGSSFAAMAYYGWNGTAQVAGVTINPRATEAWTGSANGTRIQFRCIATGTTTLTEYGSLDSRGWVSERGLLLKAMAAPAAQAGYAYQYLDSADGDLKVVFPNGTVKTIQTD